MKKKRFFLNDTFMNYGINNFKKTLNLIYRINNSSAEMTKKK